MRQNVIHLQQFYGSPMGRAGLAMPQRRLAALWDADKGGLDILGFGYATPFLESYREGAKRVILAMPGEQGTMVTQSKRGNITCLVEEDALPFPTASFDRILIAHGLEDSPCLPELMDELWRIMKPEGRLVIIAPNRAGLWARSDASPFGHGRPFTRGQLSRLLRAAQFEPTAWAGALYVPPLPWLMKSGIINGFERFGELVWPRFSGLVLVEALKRLYADTDTGTSQVSRAPKFVGVGAAEPSLNTHNRQNHEH